MKVYNKKGNKSYKEKRLIQALEDFFEKNPDQYDLIEVPEDFAQLQALHDKYVFDEAEVESVVQTKVSSSGDEFIDPMNRASPIIRDYVTDNNQANVDVTNDFKEPVDFHDAFDIPSEEELEAANQEESSGSRGEYEKTESAKKYAPEPPIFNDGEIDPKKRKRKAQRFASSIVNITCDLYQFGFVWFTSKDITEEKLLEAEQEFGIDLDLLLEMNDGQKTTVRNFFNAQRAMIQQVSIIGKEDREDLTDALVEVFLEKGIQPTATQDLILIGLKVFGGKTLEGYALWQPVKIVLSQLKSEAAARHVTQNFEENYAEAPAKTATESQTDEEDNWQEEAEHETDEVEFPEFTELEEVE